MGGIQGIACHVSPYVRGISIETEHPYVWVCPTPAKSTTHVANTPKDMIDITIRWGLTALRGKLNPRVTEYIKCITYFVAVKNAFISHISLNDLWYSHKPTEMVTTAAPACSEARGILEWLSEVRPDESGDGNRALSSIEAAKSVRAIANRLYI